MGAGIPANREESAAGGEGKTHRFSGAAATTFHRARSGLVKTNTELWPPNPKELLMATSILRRRARLGV